MSKRASEQVSGQVIDFGFAKHVPEKKEKAEIPVTVQARYDKETQTFWFGIPAQEHRAGNKTMIILESDGVEKTSLRAPNDKGEAVNIIGSYRFMVPMSDAWVKANKKAKEKGE